MNAKEIIQQAETGEGGYINYRLNAKIGKKDAVALKSLLYICDEWNRQTGNECTVGETLDILDNARWFLLTESIARAGDKDEEDREGNQQ
jgi:hypothetical protein